jgi:hypothetical protein
MLREKFNQLRSYLDKLEQELAQDLGAPEQGMTVGISFDDSIKLTHVPGEPFVEPGCYSSGEHASRMLVEVIAQDNPRQVLLRNAAMGADDDVYFMSPGIFNRLFQPYQPFGSVANQESTWFRKTAQRPVDNSPQCLSEYPEPGKDDPTQF